MSCALRSLASASRARPSPARLAAVTTDRYRDLGIETRACDCRDVRESAGFETSFYVPHSFADGL
jgi:hypothetical protein